MLDDHNLLLCDFGRWAGWSPFHKLLPPLVGAESIECPEKSADESTEDKDGNEHGFDGEPDDLDDNPGDSAEEEVAREHSCR